MRSAALILALGALAAILNPSNAWWSRRRRSCSAVNCRVSGWTAWSSCTRSCGGGSTTRTRRKTSSASCGGSCPYNLVETKICNTHCCSVDCVYTWGAWSICKGCGNSTQTRVPKIIKQNSCSGRACPTNETRSCNTGV